MNPEFERLLALGNHLFAARSWARAATELEAALRLEPDNNRAHLLLARCFFQLERLADARRHIESALQNQPEDIEALCLDADTAPDAARAFASVEKALALRPNAAFLHIQLAVICLRRRSWGLGWSGRGKCLKRAENAARRAIEIEPQHAGAHRVLASALLAQGKNSVAHWHTMKSLELQPENPRAHVLLSFLRSDEKDGAGTERAIREALRLDPENRGLQRRLRNHLVSERLDYIFGERPPPWQFSPGTQPCGLTYRIYRVLFEKLPPLARLPALLVVQTIVLFVLAAISMGRGNALFIFFLFLLGIFCFFLVHTPYAARPYLARVPQKFLPDEFKPWGKTEPPTVSTNTDPANHD